MKIKKYWFIITIVILCLLRFLLSYSIPTFYASNLSIDDTLMVRQLKSLYTGKYLGLYYEKTLIKGIMFPLVLFYIKTLKLTFNNGFTILYILSCLYFIKSISKIINNKIELLILFIFLLFNPLTYSSELFQRLYSNTISITELLFFLGLVINIISSKKNSIVNYILLGVITSCMYLTRDDNIWALIVLFILFIYKVYKNYSIKNIFINLLPVLILILGLSYVSLLNYKYYKIFAYSELDQTYFKEAYTKVLQIKDDKKLDKVAIPKSTYYKLCEKSKVIGCSKMDVDILYDWYLFDGNEVNNSKAIWLFRKFIYERERFKNGKEANQYFKDLSSELDELFNKGELEKEAVLPSVFMYSPTKNEIREFPINMLYAIWYTSSYKNVKTFNKEDLLKLKDIRYDKFSNSYTFPCVNSRSLENVINNNSLLYEIIRLIYKYFTSIFGVIAFVIYLFNIKKIDKRNIILHILLLIYLMIMFGIVYTHTTAFHAIRYRYLCNVYIIQNLFILLNLGRLFEKKRRIK